MFSIISDFLQGGLLYQAYTAITSGDLFVLLGVICSSAVLLLVCLPVHEYCHALAAYKLGDSTAKYQGRLTLNPIKHLDVIGSLMILFVGIGYAKPVPVNMLNFRDRKKDMALTAAAGPISNLLMGVVFTFLHALLNRVFSFFVINEALYYIYIILAMVFLYGGIINISLAIFNLIPVPPFDGSRILGLFLPDRIYYKIMEYERIIFIVVLVVLLSGVLSGWLSAAVSGVFYGLNNLFTFILGG